MEARLLQSSSVMRGGRYELSPILEEKGYGRKIPARNTRRGGAGVMLFQLGDSRREGRVPPFRQ